MRYNERISLPNPPIYSDMRLSCTISKTEWVMLVDMCNDYPYRLTIWEKAFMQSMKIYFKRELGQHTMVWVSSRQFTILKEIYEKVSE